MEQRFATPAALVEALHNRGAEARAQFQEWMREPVRRLLDELSRRHGLGHSLQRLTEHALHSAEAFVRTRPPRQFAAMNVGAFRAAVLLFLARQVVEPFGGQRNGDFAAPEALPESAGYACQTVYLPSEKVGTHRFGGDWYGGRAAGDGTLWVIVADITGHGYAAYLLANALPGVWRACWLEVSAPDPRPADVLGVMHGLLRDCLPDGVFVECTLARLAPGGEVTIAPAGGSRLLFRCRRENRLDLLKLRGLWLGLEPPSPDDQRTYTLEEGDELLFGSDGTFDQLADYEGSATLARLIAECAGSGDLFAAVRDALDRALRERPQRDDITVVLVRRLRGELGG